MMSKLTFILLGLISSTITQTTAFHHHPSAWLTPELHQPGTAALELYTTPCSCQPSAACDKVLWPVFGMVDASLTGSITTQIADRLTGYYTNTSN